MVAEIRPLHTGAGWSLGDRVLGEVERNSFIALLGRGGHSGLMPTRLVCPALEGVVWSLTVSKEQGVVSLRTLFWLVGGEVIGSRHHQPSGSIWSGVCVLVGSMQLTSPTFHLVGLAVAAKQLKGHGSEYDLYSPWDRTKRPWFCLVAKILLFCLAWLSSFLSAFSHFSD